MKLSSKTISFKYLIGIVIILSLILGSIFVIFYNIQKKILFEEVHNQADILIDQIILTRKWISDMNGVYVIQRKGMHPNKYLNDPLIECGKITFLKRNPAMVTRELSEYSKKFSKYFFKLTSDFVINLKNVPDGTERYALYLFKEKKFNEYSKIEILNNKKYYRLIRPVYITKSCLKCHWYQGYRLGDLRGCISVFIPICKVLNNLSKIKKYLIISAILIVVLTVILIYMLNYFLVIKPISYLKNSIDEFEKDYTLNFTPSKRIDEIGELERKFFQMANTIKNNHEIMKKEIEKATEELKKKDKMKTDFIATVSHELRTPLTTIQGGVEYLSKVLKKKENIEFVEIIDKNIKNLILMVNNLIDIARIELGKLELNLKEENLKEIIKEVLIFFKGYAIEKSITFEKRNFFDAFVFVDRRRINQVFINVIHNAIKFSPENEKIVIEMANNIEFGNISVSIINRTVEDLKIEDVNKFFIKYKYLTNRKEKGSGLGLAIAKGIMEAHKGDIVVEILDKKTIKFKIVFSTELEKNEQGNKNINC